MKKVTLETIAKEVGVSKVAVFKALNNQKGVSEALRKKIQEQAKNLGYRTQTITKEVKNRRFLFFVSQEFFLSLSEQYYSTIFYFLSAECNKTNNLLQIAYLEPDNTLEKIKKAISSYRPDGIFFAGEVSQEILEYMQKLSIATVFIDFYSPLFDCNYVYQDNYHLSYVVTNYLVKKGHTKVGFVGNITSTSAIADRYFGYLKALAEHNITPNSQWHINANIEKSSDIIWLDLKEYPTAFVCHCDAAARWLYTALATRNLVVPDDVSVVGFDDTELCENLQPKLSSAGPKKEQYAKKSFSLMMNALSTSGKPQQIKINTDFSVRHSVCSKNTRD